jgi:rare lipoprotein A
VKSFLGMLLVAGVFALSLVAFQGEARAEEMVSSWYGPGLGGGVTASGEVFEPYSEYTCAHKTLPFDTHLLVTYRGESVVCRVNDRGPYVYGHDLDLSFSAAQAIGLTDAGTGLVEVHPLPYN